MGWGGGTHDGYDFNLGRVTVEIGRGHQFIQHTVDFPGLHELVPVHGTAYGQTGDTDAGLRKKPLRLGDVVRKTVDDREKGNTQGIRGGLDRHGNQ